MWEYELVGPWTFRVKPSQFRSNHLRWTAEAKRGPFEARDIFHEQGDCWFEYGETREEALRKLKAEVLS